jgi:hypothetical protein
MLLSVGNATAVSVLIDGGEPLGCHQNLGPGMDESIWDFREEQTKMNPASESQVWLELEQSQMSYQCRWLPSKPGMNESMNGEQRKRNPAREQRTWLGREQLQ